MGIYEQYKRIHNSKGSNARERNQRTLKQSFEEILNSSANAYDIQCFLIDDIPFKHFKSEEVIIDDTNSGLKNSNDDSKKLMCRIDSRIETGMYILWKDMNWLITAQELATTDSYKKFTIRPCFVYISKEIDGIVYDFPVVFENLSLKTKFGTDVKADSVGFQIDASTEQILVPNHKILKELIDVNKRIMLNKEKVFEIKKTNNFASKGITIASIEQVVQNEKDDFEKNIADYTASDIEPPIIVGEKELLIKGDKLLKIGTTRTYTAEVYENNEINEEENILITLNSIEDTDNIEDIVEIVEINDRNITIKAKKEVKNINKKIKVIFTSLDTEDLQESIEVGIKSIM